MLPSEPPRAPHTSVPWFAFVCIALGIFFVWLVVHISPQKNLLAGTDLGQLELPDSLSFLQGHTFVVVVSLVLALILWALFRRPRPR